MWWIKKILLSMLPIIHLDAGGTFMVTFSIVMAQVSTLISTNLYKDVMHQIEVQRFIWQMFVFDHEFRSEEPPISRI